MIEQVVRGGYPRSPALDVHPEFDETFYLLDGTVAFRIGDCAYEARLGPGRRSSCREARSTPSPTELERRPGTSRSSLQEDSSATSEADGPDRAQRRNARRKRPP